MSAPVTPEPIMKIASGFMAAKHLFAANEVGLFAALAEGWTSVGDLARRTGLSERTAAISADAMVALALVEKDGTRYRNAEAAQAFLAGTSPADLRPFLRFWDRLSYPAWQSLAESLRSGSPASKHAPTEEETRIFAEGVEAITAGAALGLTAAYDFSKHKKLLDLGGGTGSFLAAILAKNASMTGTLMELPDTAAVARRLLPKKPGIEGRAEIVAGSFLTDAVPAGHDVLLAANVVHCLSPENNLVLFRRARAAVSKGARLLLPDFWLEPSHAAPVFAALMSGEFLIHTGEGKSYGVDETSGWLASTGWKAIETRPLAGPQSMIVAEAV